MQRARISACIGWILASLIAANAPAQAKHSAGRIGMEQAAAGEVHITPSTMRAGSTSIEVGGDRWNARGYDLAALISEIYGVDARRIEFAENGNTDARWDVTLQLAHEMDEDVMERLLKSALERRFGVKITPETRQMDVYVLTAPHGPGAALHVHGSRAAGMTKLVSGGQNGQNAGDIADDDGEDAGQITYNGRDCSGVVSSSGIEASAAAIGEFRRTLEPDLDRLVVDETHLSGSYDFKIGTYANQDELFQRMRQELGIVVTPGQRPVEMLTVRPAQELHAAL